MDKDNKEISTRGLDILLDHISFEERQKSRANKYRLMVERAKKRRRRVIYLTTSLSVAGCLIAVFILGPLLWNQVGRDELFSKYFEPFDFQTSHRGAIEEADEYIIAVDLFKENKLSQSHEIVIKLMEKAPNNPDNMLLLSMILMKQENYAKAIDYLQIISRQGGSYETISLWYIGLCRLGLEQYDKAETIYKSLKKSGSSQIGKKSRKIHQVLLFL